nr:immunoglobulin light chain junction region [Macaca mulatta]MOV73793.1 immunoglobulin light chain junction region [Macaca mulatta]MOX41616.1 immunoglobulin light chain junction region [Macaca mulatta]MOX42174.1 immunoglobulin light chain junction region [Macaca mulatta]MOX42242.1 immunoglobulin light chain junction region [Macaca mulatta]
DYYCQVYDSNTWVF